MRIVHLVSEVSAEAGGVARAVLDSALALASHADVHILSYDIGHYDFPWGDSPPARLRVSLIPAAARTGLANPAMKAAIHAIARDADLFHLHGMWQPMMAFAAAAARKRGTPYICSIHGMLDPWSMSQRAMKKRIYFSLIEKGRLTRAAAIHLTTEAELQKAAPWLPAAPKKLVIPLILDLDPYRELPGPGPAAPLLSNVPTGAPCVLFLSRIHEKKGLDLLITAMAAVRPSAHLIVAGTGDQRYVAAMKRLAQERGVAGRVHFIGLVRGTQKLAIYQRAAALAVPSSQENFGLVFAEALACNTPVLLTRDVDIFPDVTRAGAGQIIRRDPADIAKHIEEILSDPARARAMGDAGRKWVFETLNPDVIARQWMQAYQAAIQSAAPSPAPRAGS